MFIKMPYPGYYRANIMHEYILVLQKGMPARGRAEPIPLNRVVKRELANSIWNIAPVPPGTIRHPVPFPEQIPWRLATLLTKPGDMIMDPMNGSGQTTRVARQMGRRYLGFDIKQEYVLEARKRLRGSLRTGVHLTPVFVRESWSESAQDGSFSATEVDMSSHIPNGYKMSHKIMSERGACVYFANEKSNYLAFIIEGKKHYRLNIGSVGDRDSMLGQLLAKLPRGRFSRADLAGVLKTQTAGSWMPAGKGVHRRSREPGLGRTDWGRRPAPVLRADRGAAPRRGGPSEGRRARRRDPDSRKGPDRHRPGRRGSARISEIGNAPPAKGNFPDLGAGAGRRLGVDAGLFLGL